MRAKRKDAVQKESKLIHQCFPPEELVDLHRLRTAWESLADESPESELSWLTLISILRNVSHVGTAQWQYVLPSKKKQRVASAFSAYSSQMMKFFHDMSNLTKSSCEAILYQEDARLCASVKDNSVNLVITSPPYPNNYDYADATRLEMCFTGEIEGWKDLQSSVREHLVRSCSQHTTCKNVDLTETLEHTELNPIRDELSAVCQNLAEVRLTKGGKKNYHLMVSSYFLDLARVWIALRRVCRAGADVYFVIGDSAPYGVYIPVHDWLSRLAVSAGFGDWSFEKIRNRNTKWKNRKHRVPLCEGILKVRG